MKKLFIITLLLTFTMGSFAQVIWLKTTELKLCNSNKYEPHKTDIKIDYENQQICIWAPKEKTFVVFNIIHKLESDDGASRITEYTCKNIGDIYKIRIYTYSPTNKIVGVNVVMPDACVLKYLI